MFLYLSLVLYILQIEAFWGSIFQPGTCMDVIQNECMCMYMYIEYGLTCSKG